jgi:hypothetical protein
MKIGYLQETAAVFPPSALSPFFPTKKIAPPKRGERFSPAPVLAHRIIVIRFEK